MAGFVPENEYLSLLEQLIRGKTFDKPNKTTMVFAEIYQAKLRLSGCLGPNKELIMDCYREALERGDMDIDLLCTAIGEEPLDQKFMQMQLTTSN